jgi:hypothetical protein
MLNIFWLWALRLLFKLVNPKRTHSRLLLLLLLPPVSGVARQISSYRR